MKRRTISILCKSRSFATEKSLILFIIGYFKFNHNTFNTLNWSIMPCMCVCLSVCPDKAWDLANHWTDCPLIIPRFCWRWEGRPFPLQILRSRRTITILLGRKARYYKYSHVFSTIVLFILNLISTKNFLSSINSNFNYA